MSPENFNRAFEMHRTTLHQEIGGRISSIYSGPILQICSSGTRSFPKQSILLKACKRLSHLPRSRLRLGLMTTFTSLCAPRGSAASGSFCRDLTLRASALLSRVELVAADGSCPSGTQSCGEGSCCPSSSFCRAGGKRIGTACCPSGEQPAYS